MSAASLVVAAILLGVGAVCSIVRLWRGPSLADRVVAMDLLVIVAIGVCALIAVKSGAFFYLDIGLILAVLSFVGTIVFAQYVEQGGK